MHELHYLLPLLRFAINTDNNSISFSDEIDWDAIMTMAMNHGLDAIAFDGLQSVYDTLSPSDAAKLDESLGTRRYDWMGLMLKAEQDYEAYLNKLRDLVSILNERNIQVLVLKGYGLSLYYPVPKHRPTGDIDIYLFGRGEYADELIKTELGIEVKQNEDMHSIFHYQGIVVENHASFLNVVEHKSLKAIESYLEQEALSAPIVSLGGAKIHVPSPSMNAVFLPCHIASHFIFGGIHLKQLLDWAVFVMKNGKFVDWDIVRRLSFDAGCFEFFRALNEIVEEHFKVPSNCLPDWGKNKSLANKIWADTLYPHNCVNRNLIEKVIDYLSAHWKFSLVYRERMICNFFRHSWAFFRGKYLPNSRSVWRF